MKTAVFGATGRAGRLVVEEIVDRGWACRVLVRNKTKLARSEGLTVLEGDARSLHDVKQTIEEVDVVFSCLRMSDMFIPATDHSDAVKTILHAMHEYTIQRFIGIASAGILDHPTGGYRYKEGTPEILLNTAREEERIYEALRDSTLNWTLMCPVFLKEDIPPGRGKYAFEDLPPGSNETGYKDLAQTMVALVEDVKSFRKRLGIVSFR